MPGKTVAVLAGQHGPGSGVLRGVAVARQTSTTLVAKYVSSLLPLSPSLSADGERRKIIRPTRHLVQSVTDRACIPMLTNVGRLQRGQPLTRSCLPSSQPKPHELPVKKCKLENGREVAPALVSPTKIEEGWKQARSRRERRGLVRSRAHATVASLACQHPLFDKSSFLQQNRVTAATVQLHGHTQRVSGLCENDAGRAKVVAKVGRDGSGDAGTYGAGDYLMAAVKFVGWIQNFSDLSRAARLWKAIDG